MATQQENEPSSTRPYLIRALHEWCTDNGLTPYVTVAVDGSVQVPLEYVKDGEIVLNIGMDATTALRMGNDYLEFKARFSGAVREIIVPMEQVIAIFARENGQGMAFPKPDRPSLTRSAGSSTARPAIKLANAKAKDQSQDQLTQETAGTDPLREPAADKPKPIKASSKPTLTRIK
jgi:stringent starvation protein B